MIGFLVFEDFLKGLVVFQDLLIGLVVFEDVDRVGCV